MSACGGRAGLGSGEQRSASPPPVSSAGPWHAAGLLRTRVPPPFGAAGRTGEWTGPRSACGAGVTGRWERGGKSGSARGAGRRVGRSGWDCYRRRRFAAAGRVGGTSAPGAAPRNGRRPRSSTAAASPDPSAAAAPRGAEPGRPRRRLGACGSGSAEAGGVRSRPGKRPAGALGERQCSLRETSRVRSGGTWAGGVPRLRAACWH